jgi:RNA polymerase sigma-70 factor (ECF subfamily)
VLVYAGRRSAPQDAPVQLKSLREQGRGVAVAESDPLPPADARARGDDGGFLEKLYRAHHDGLMRFVRRRTRNEPAHDVVQRVFCRLAGLAEHDQRRIAAPAAYLRRAADNMLRDDARADVRRSAAFHVGEDEVALRSEDQWQALEARDRLRRLEDALLRLKPRTREIFLAHRIDGFSYAEIAARTGLSIKTVEMHMTRAIAFLDQHRRDG